MSSWFSIKKASSQSTSVSPPAGSIHPSPVQSFFSRLRRGPAGFWAKNQQAPDRLSTLSTPILIQIASGLPTVEAVVALALVNKRLLELVKAHDREILSVIIPRQYPAYKLSLLRVHRAGEISPFQRNHLMFLTAPLIIGKVDMSLGMEGYGFAEHRALGKLDLMISEYLDQVDRELGFGPWDRYAARKALYNALYLLATSFHHTPIATGHLTHPGTYWWPPFCDTHMTTVDFSVAICLPLEEFLAAISIVRLFASRAKPDWSRKALKLGGFGEGGVFERLARARVEGRLEDVLSDAWMGSSKVVESWDVMGRMKWEEVKVQDGKGRVVGKYIATGW